MALLLASCARRRFWSAAYVDCSPWQRVAPPRLGSTRHESDAGKRSTSSCSTCLNQCGGGERDSDARAAIVAAPGAARIRNSFLQTACDEGGTFLLGDG